MMPIPVTMFIFKRKDLFSQKLGNELYRLPFLVTSVLNNFISVGRKKLEPEEVKVFYFDYSGFQKILNKVEVLIMVDLSIIEEDCLGEVLRQIKTKIPPMEEEWSVQIMAVHGAAIEF